MNSKHQEQFDKDGQSKGVPHWKKTKKGSKTYKSSKMLGLLHDHVEEKITGIEADPIFKNTSEHFDPYIKKVIKYAEINLKEKLEDERTVCDIAIRDYKKKVHEYLKITENKKGNDDPNSDISRMKNSWFSTIYEQFNKRLFGPVPMCGRLLRAAVLYERVIKSSNSPDKVGYILLYYMKLRMHIHSCFDWKLYSFIYLLVHLLLCVYSAFAVCMVRCRSLSHTDHK